MKRQLRPGSGEYYDFVIADEIEYMYMKGTRFVSQPSQIEITLSEVEYLRLRNKMNSMYDDGYDYRWKGESYIYVVNTTNWECGIIWAYNIDSQNGEYYNLTGNSIDCLLDKDTCLGGTYIYPAYQSISVKASQAVVKMLEEGSNVSEEDYPVPTPCLFYGNDSAISGGTNPYIYTYPVPESGNVTGYKTLKILSELCDAYYTSKLGVRRANMFKINIFLKRKKYNNVIFSLDDDSILNYSYNYDASNYHRIYKAKYVGDENIFSKTVNNAIYSGGVGSTVTNRDNVDLGTEIQSSSEANRVAQQMANLASLDYLDTTTFSFTPNPNCYKYLTDYDIGDEILVHLSKFGIYQKIQIAKITEIYENGHLSVELDLGDLKKKKF